MPVALPNVPFPVIRARVTIYSADRGGRRLPIHLTGSRYMPHLVVDGGNGEYLGVLFCAEVDMELTAEIPTDCDLGLLYHPQVDYSPLLAGRRFKIVEGPKPVGEGIVIDPPALGLATRCNGTT